LVLQDCMEGVGVNMGSANGSGPTSASPELVHVRMIHDTSGLYILGTFGPGPDVGVVRVKDSEFVNAPIGMYVSGRHSKLEMDRCVMRGNTDYPIDILCSASTAGGLAGSLVLRDSLIVDNSILGVRIRAPVLGVSEGLIVGCTIAHNSDAGVREDGGRFEIANSIVWGQTQDLLVHSYAVVRHCDYATGAAPGPGDIHVDPMFRNAAGGDYRLRFGSPCVDSADLVNGTQTDFTGTSRRLDGNLDTLRAPDMGAYELETLGLSGTPSLGQPIGLEFLGPAGAISLLYAAHAAPVSPQATSFGLLYMPPGITVQSATVTAQPGPPYVLRRRIPNDPVLIGTTYSFQALIDSATAPAGRAYTNPITFMVLP
jgi:hypothetical protein